MTSRRALMQACLATLVVCRGPDARAAALAAKDGSTVRGNDEQRHYLRPEQFGAIGDGVSDDTAAMTRAWNRMIATRGRLVLDSKVYRINAPLPVITEPCSVVGSGSQKSWISYGPTATGNAITTRNVWFGA